MQTTLATFASRAGIAAGVILLLALLMSGLILLKEPMAPVLVIGAAVAATIGLILLQHPLRALYVALFLVLLPPGGLRIEGVYQLAANGAVALALGAWLVHSIAQHRAVRWNATLLLVVLYLAWGVVTLLWAPDLIAGRRKLVEWTISFLMLFLIINQVRTLGAVDSLMRVLRVMGWILILAGLYAMIFSIRTPDHRLDVVGINQNTLGMMLIATMPGVMWPVLRAKGSRRAVTMTLSVVFILCVLAIIALSGSRAGAVSIVILLASFLFSKPTRLWGILGVVLVLAIVAVAPFLLDVLVQRFESEEGGELGGRGYLWQASLLLIRDFFWSGVGVGNGPLQLNRYLASLSSGVHRIDLPSHQPFLEVTVETGVFGLLVYCGIIASGFWAFWRARSAWHASEAAPKGYYAIMCGIWFAYTVAWIKSGGVENHPSFIVLISLLLVPALLSPSRAVQTDAPAQPARLRARWPHVVG